jgi:putative ABC transport system permease protein
MKALLRDAGGRLRSQARATLAAIFGLMVAQAACLLVGLFALALASPDPQVPDVDRVVILDFKGNPPGEPSPWFTESPVAFGPLLKERHAPLDLISRTTVGGLTFRLDGRITPAYLLLADPDLVDVLHLTSLAGDLRATLAGKDSIAITTDLLHKLWGELTPAQAIGHRLESDGRWLVVTAVIPDAHARSPIWDATPLVGHAMVIAGFDSVANDMTPEDRSWIYLMTGRVFARLRPGTSVDQVGGWMRDAFRASPRFGELPPEWSHNREPAFFRGVTLKQLPFEGAGSEARWQMLGAAGAACVLLLLLAGFNTMNLQAAGLLQRQRETALRRSLGADGPRLLGLWAMEAGLPLLLAAGGALLIAWWTAPAIANWIGLSPDLPVADPLPWPALAGLAACVLVLLPLTLVLPAWSALRRPPATALQGRTASEGPWGRRVRQILLGLQLGGALALLSLAGVLTVQQHHLLNVDRGFDTHDRLVLHLETDPEKVPSLAALAEALSHSPAITHWTSSWNEPARETDGTRQVHQWGTHTPQMLRVSEVSPSFFDTYGMVLIAGSPQYTAGEANLVIDAKAARLLGFPTPQSAVGALLKAGAGFDLPGDEPHRVVGVVKDVTLESGRDPVRPQAFRLSERTLWNITATGPDPVALRRAFEDAWRTRGLQMPYEFQWADDQRADVYRQEGQLTTAVTVISLLAVLVAMLGAYAMVADTLRRRRTELVLHRLHGASDAAIARQVGGEFGVPLLAAAVVALPLAAWVGWLYLTSFRDHVAPALGLAGPLLAAALVTTLVTALASLRHVRQALALQPIEALN